MEGFDVEMFSALFVFLWHYTRFLIKTRLYHLQIRNNPIYFRFFTISSTYKEQFNVSLDNLNDVLKYLDCYKTFDKTDSFPFNICCCCEI